MLTPGWLRFGGTLFVIMGTGIAGTLLYILWWMVGVWINNGDPNAKNHFTGTPLQAVGIFALLSAVIMFGVTYIAMGVWWILRGTRNPWILRAGWLGYLLMALAFAVLQLGMD
jgi:hypothetical protein